MPYHPKRWIERAAQAHCPGRAVLELVSSFVDQMCHQVDGYIFTAPTAIASLGLAFTPNNNRITLNGLMAT
jgi:hypothetical protein